MDAEHDTCDCGTKEISSGDCSVKSGNGFAAILESEPAREIDHYAGIEACFSSTQQEARGVELSGCVDEGGENGDQTPRNHDARDPFASAPSLDQDGAGNLEQNISQEENAGSQAIHAIGESEVNAHAESCEGDIDAIDEIDEVEKTQKREEARSNSAAGGDHGGSFENKTRRKRACSVAKPCDARKRNRGRREELTVERCGARRLEADIVHGIVRINPAENDGFARVGL